MKFEAPAVKKLATEFGIPVYQPESLKDGEAERIVRELAPDVSVAVAYGKLLPQSLIDAPKFGTVNVHASLLPRWRGAAPIQRAIMNGDTETGVCVQQMRLELDEGGIISKKITAIGENETYGELYDRLKILGAELLLETLSVLPAEAIAQSGEVTYAPPIRREDCYVDWSSSAREIANQIRGLCPKPGASAELGGEKFKIYKAHVGSGGALTVPCGGGSALVIDELQAPGGKRMRTEDYLRGHTITVNS
jgi:methionyl-tRNA formyltransferase